MLVVILVRWMWLLCWLWLWFVVCGGAVESTVWIVEVVALCGCVVVALWGIVWLCGCGIVPPGRSLPAVIVIRPQTPAMEKVLLMTLKSKVKAMMINMIID